jgi:hypothetical protein
MRIDSSGNVGIGTSSPNKKLEVVSAGEIIRATSSTGANDQVISIKSNSGTADCSTNIFFADRYAATSYASSYIRGTTSGTSALIFATGGTNFTNIYDAGAPTERMRIDSSGNVGIGTASPGAAVGGKCVTIYNTNHATLSIQAVDGGNDRSATLELLSSGNGGSYSQILYGDTDTTPGTPSPLVFAGYHSGTRTERMRIDSSGTVLVNTTTRNSSGVVEIKTTIGTDNALVLKTAESGAGGTATMMQTRYNATTVGSITSTSSATAYNTSSDYRLKEDIAPMTGALEKVAALKPVTYKWKVDGSDGQGFIAHELAEVCPHAVSGAKDAVDADGKSVYQGIDVSFLVATLTKAIQEQQVLIAQLQADVAALQAK